MKAKILALTHLGDRLEILLALGEERLRTYADPSMDLRPGEETGLVINGEQLFEAA